MYAASSTRNTGIQFSGDMDSLSFERRECVRMFGSLLVGGLVTNDWLSLFLEEMSRESSIVGISTKIMPKISEY